MPGHPTHRSAPAYDRVAYRRRTEPLYANGLDRVIPGSNCIANAYTSNHEEIINPATGTGRRFALHVVDGVGFVHAILLRIQVALMPFRTLVLGGH